MRCTPAYSSAVAIGESAAQGDPDLLAAAREALAQLEEDVDPRAVDVLDVGEVEDEPARVARDARGDRRAEIAGVGHVDLALQVRDDDARERLEADVGQRAHSDPKRRRMTTSVPASVVRRSSSSTAAAMIFRPRPRLVPRGARQRPVSRTVRVTSPSACSASSSK